MFAQNILWVCHLRRLLCSYFATFDNKRGRRLINQELATGLEPFRWKLPLKYLNMLMFHFRGIFTPNLVLFSLSNFSVWSEPKWQVWNLPQITVQTQLLNFRLTKRGSLSPDQTDSRFSLFLVSKHFLMSSDFWTTYRKFHRTEKVKMSHSSTQGEEKTKISIEIWSEDVIKSQLGKKY